MVSTLDVSVPLFLSLSLSLFIHNSLYFSLCPYFSRSLALALVFIFQVCFPFLYFRSSFKFPILFNLLNFLNLLSLWVFFYLSLFLCLFTTVCPPPPPPRLSLSVSLLLSPFSTAYFLLSVNKHSLSFCFCVLILLSSLCISYLFHICFSLSQTFF